MSFLPSDTTVRKPGPVGLGALVGRRPRHRAQLGRARLRALGVPHRRDLGIGEGDARDRAVVGLHLLPEHVRGGHATLVLGHMGELRDPGDVADRPHALRRAKAVVDLDAVPAGLDADGVEPDAVGAHAPPGRDQQLVALDLEPAVERHLHAAAVVRGDRRDVDAGAHVDALLGQPTADGLADGARLARDEPVAALDDRHLGPEPAHRLGHLGADRAATDHDQVARDLLRARDLPVRPDAVERRDPVDRRDERVAPGGDDDPVRLDAPAGDLDHASAGDPRLAAQDVDAAIGQPGHLAAVVVVADHVVAPAQYLGDLEVAVDGLASARRLERLLARIARAQERLRGDAAPVAALAADELALHHRDPHAAVGERAGADLAARSGADHDRVVGLVTHGAFSLSRSARRPRARVWLRREPGARAGAVRVRSGGDERPALLLDLVHQLLEGVGELLHALALEGLRRSRRRRRRPPRSAR